MKKLIIILVAIFCATFSISAKINWVYDMQTAKAMAIGENKLIVIDFWATWCGPCKKMESEFWATNQVDEFKDNIVFLKVDIDSNPRLSSKYGVRGIPYVVVADVVGNKIWDVVGYSGGSSIAKILKGLPANVEQINKSELPFLNETVKDVDFINVGKSYAEIGKGLNNKELKRGFLSLSSRLFKKVKKGELAEEAELRLLLNKVYFGQTKSVKKKLAKIPETPKNKALRATILEHLK